MKILVVIILLYSCRSYKKEMIDGSLEIDKAIENIIIDVNNTYPKQQNLAKKRRKPFNVFFITVKNISKKDYYQIDVDADWGYFTQVDSIGSIPAYFPNNFKEIDNKLFLWNNKKTTLNRQTLTVMDRYKVLDSSEIKAKNFIHDFSTEQYDDILYVPGVKRYYYFVCKENIRNYQKIQSRRIIEFEELVKKLSLKCTR